MTIDTTSSALDIHAVCEPDRPGQRLCQSLALPVSLSKPHRVWAPVWRLHACFEHRQPSTDRSAAYDHPLITVQVHIDPQLMPVAGCICSVLRMACRMASSAGEFPWQVSPVISALGSLRRRNAIEPEIASAPTPSLGPSLHIKAEFHALMAGFTTQNRSPAIWQFAPAYVLRQRRLQVEKISNKVSAHG